MTGGLSQYSEYFLLTYHYVVMQLKWWTHLKSLPLIYSAVMIWWEATRPPLVLTITIWISIIFLNKKSSNSNNCNYLYSLPTAHPVNFISVFQTFDCMLACSAYFGVGNHLFALMCVLYSEHVIHSMKKKKKLIELSIGLLVLSSNIRKKWLWYPQIMSHCCSWGK